MRLACSLLMLLLLAGGCSTSVDFQTAGVATEFKSPEGDALYQIGTGDVLEITVYGEESLNRTGLVVRPDGKISFPLVGDIEVGGLTTTQAKDSLEKQLREYIPGAVAAVSVVQLGSLQYYVVGKVNKPGMYNVSKPLTVLQALAMAGGLTPFADESKIIIMRNYGSETARLPFNYKKIKRGLNVEENILLKRGDVVVVP
ncbi:MAG: polysaccharide export protein [Desulfobacteraceae bacterium]|nr:polysaccharide export protein [Desulfobacteraceae bacterium]